MGDIIVAPAVFFVPGPFPLTLFRLGRPGIQGQFFIYYNEFGWGGGLTHYNVAAWLRGESNFISLFWHVALACSLC